MKRILCLFILVAVLSIFLIPNTVFAANYAFRPTAAGNLTQLTPTAGANWDNVEEVVTDNSTTIVRRVHTTGGYGYDLYTVANHTSEAGTITNVRIYNVIWAHSSAYYKTLIETHGLVCYGAEVHPNNLVYVETYTDYANNPYTGVAWTWEEIDLMQAGTSGKGTAGVTNADISTVWIVVTAYAGPEVTTDEATNIDYISVTLNGNITSIEGSATIRGFEYDTNSGAPYASNWTEEGSFEEGAYSYNLTVTPDTTYYYRVIVYDEVAYTYGDEVSFKTLTPLPGVPTNFTATQVGYSSIALNWTNGLYKDNTTIRVRNERYPTTISEGYLVYNGTSDNTLITGLNPTEIESYGFSAWEYNEIGYSTTYATASIGGESMTFISTFWPFMLVGLAITGLATWQRKSRYKWIWAIPAFGIWILLAFMARNNTDLAEGNSAMPWAWFMMFVAIGVIVLIVIGLSSAVKTPDDIRRERLTPGEREVEDYGKHLQSILTPGREAAAERRERSRKVDSDLEKYIQPH